MARHLVPDDVARLRTVADPQLSPDGRLVAFVRLEPDGDRDREVGHVHVVPAAGGEPARWTAGEHGDGSPRWSPDGRRLAFLSARGEPGVRQVWVLDAGGGEARRLTDLPGGVLELAWSPAGDRIACAAIVRPAAETEAERARPVPVRRLDARVDGMGVIAGSSAHVFVVAADGGATRRLTFGDSWAARLAWSPDGAEIAFASAVHDDRDLDRASHLFAVAAEGGEPRRITDGAGQAWAPVWTPDGRRLVFVGKPGLAHLMTGLYAVDAAGGEAVPLLDGFDRTVMLGVPGYPGGPPQLSADGRRVTFCARVGGCVHLFRLGLDDGRVEELEADPDRVVSGFSIVGDTVAYVVADSRQPGDLFLREGGGAECRLTDLNRAVVEAAPPVRPRRRTFTAPDGVEVEAFLYLPEGGGPAPLLLDVHGGPHNAHGPTLSGAYLYRQELVARGWAVVAPNPRGSDGYGLRFMEGVRGGWGRLDQQDFLAVIDGLVAQGVADPERLAVTGYSYGGYATGWLVSRDRRFRAAVAGAPVADLVSQYGGSDIGTTMSSVELGAEPFESWSLYDELSPVRGAARIETPLLLLHGDADMRCPIGQSEELLALLRRRRREVELVRYPGSSHAFPLNGRISHRIDYQRRLVDWVTSHVEAVPAPRPARAAPGLRERLQERLAEAAERLGVPGAAAGVLIDGEEHYAFHGVTSVENRLPVDARTLFQIGSTTKTFTATALMRQVERGEVDLEAPVRRSVPDLRLRDEEVAERVTVLQLLNHTAGWLGDHFLDTGDGADALERYAASLADLDQVTPLGAFASYNNAAVSLAGHVLARVAGTTYEAALRELLLEPLGLRDSLLFPADVMSRRFAVGHVAEDGEARVARPWNLPRSAWPAGGLASTAADQLRWARFHLGDGEGLLRRETLERMRRPTFSLGGSGLGDEVGVSWLLRDAGGVRLASHGGGTNGQVSAFVTAPARGFAITVLTNSERGGPLNRELVAWALRAYLGIEEREPEPAALSPDELAAYAGEFRSPAQVVTVTVDGDGLVLTPRYTEAVLARLRETFGEDVHDRPPQRVRLVAGDRYVVTEGDARGSRGAFVRRDGAIAGVNLGGRLAMRAVGD